MSESRPKDARVYLERVRLQSLQSSKALLGFGWAADAMKDPQLALVPWQELAQRDFGETAVLEAQIAVPYAYAELGAYGQSLQRYESAIAAFERENADLEQSIKAIRAGKMIDTLVEQNPGEEMGWFWKIRDLAEMPRARHLAQVLAHHEFQEALKNYRDLRFLSRNLEDWREKLVIFEEMLATRRKAFADRLPAVRERQQQIDIEALVKRREAIAAEVAAGEAAGDGVAFADAKQQELLEKLKEVRRIVDAPNADEEAFKQRDRVRLVGGVLAWQLVAGLGRPPVGREGRARAHRRLARGREEACRRAVGRAARRAGALRSLRPPHRRDQPGAAGDDPARRRLEPRAARGSAGDRDRRADRPAAAHRRLHDAGALRARPALRPRVRQTGHDRAASAKP